MPCCSIVATVRAYTHKYNASMFKWGSWHYSGWVVLSMQEQASRASNHTHAMLELGTKHWLGMHVIAASNVGCRAHSVLAGIHTCPSTSFAAGAWWACLIVRKWAEVRKWGSTIAHFPIYPDTRKRKWENLFFFYFFPLIQSFSRF